MTASDDHRPLRQIVREEDDDALGGRDPERDAHAMEPQAARRARLDGAVLDVAHHASTVPAWCRDPGPPEPLQRPACGLGVGAGGGRARRRAGPAPLTSARNAPAARSSSASGELARSFAGSAARSRGRRDAARARRGARRGARPSRARRRARRTRRRRPRSRSSSCRAGEDDAPRSPAAGRAARARAVARPELRPVVRGRTARRRRCRPRARAARRRRAARRACSFARRSAVAASELPPPSPAATRDVLLDLHAPARLDPRGAPRALERGADERVACEAVDAKLRRRLDVDPVDELDPLVDGQQLVLAVVAQRADDEREVDLRRGGRALTASASRERERTRAARAPPHARRGVAADRLERRGGLLARDEARELERVRQRLPPVRERGRDDLLDPREARRAARCAGRRRARSRRSAAAGTPLRETGWKPVRSAASCTSTETAPYAFVPGRGEEPVGDLALHHHAPEPDARQAVEALDDERRRDVVRAGSRRASSRRSSAAGRAAARRRRRASTFGRRCRAGAARASRSSSTAWTRATRSAR